MVSREAFWKDHQVTGLPLYPPGAAGEASLEELEWFIKMLMGSIGIKGGWLQEFGARGSKASELSAIL